MFPSVRVNHVLSDGHGACQNAGLGPHIEPESLSLVMGVWS